MKTILLPKFLDFDVYPHIFDEENVKTHLETLYANNEKNTLIIINKGDKDHLEFLSKILKAVQYDISKDVILIAIDKEKQIGLTDIVKNVNVKTEKVLLFGMTLKQLNLQFKLPSYFPIKVNDMTFLAADNLEQISKNQSKKKQLWTALQQLFL